MGLRLLAHFLERNEAYIVGGALEAAGIVCFIDTATLSILPYHELAFGGHRVLVREEDLERALAVIDEARRKRSFEGERLSQRTYMSLSVLAYLAVGLIMPLRTTTWHDVTIDPRDKLRLRQASGAADH